MSSPVELQGSERPTTSSAVTPIPKRFPTAFTDRAMYVARGVTTGQILAVLRLKGRLDEVRFARAIRLAMDAEPILGCRFVPHWFRPYWQRCEDLDDRSFCPVRYSDDVDGEVERFFTAAPDRDAGPQIEALVLRGSTDTLCLRLSHMAGDGAAMKQFMSLLADLYRRLEAHPGYVPIPNVDGNRSLQELGRQFTLREKWRILRQTVKVLKCLHRSKARWSIPVPAQGRGERHLVGRSLPPERVRAISRFGRRLRATVNLVMLAALYRTLRHIAPASTDELMFVPSTADIRRYLPKRKTEALCNHVGSLAFFVDPARADTLDDVVLQLRDQMRAISDIRMEVASAQFAIETFPVLKWIGTLTPFALLKRAARRRHGVMQRGKPLGLAGLTNGGEVDPEQFNLGDVEVEHVALSGGTQFLPGIWGISASTYQGALQLFTSYDDRYVEPAFIERAYDRLLEELPDVASEAPPGT